ncbi:uncharacterized protein LOC132873016 isoform X2 [Neoarius graeffei]|uniref:uncharacterized protein LOC132873016 isoform X2 n=1 Tax=Neoarius graeffei TaxID=443677 RepID=UPI00298D2347|nr:uncharacterized protein LOC132873016 isoform X2 [Neoarius graeffei]
MPLYCCAPGCSNHQHTRQDLSFYRIPTDADRRRRWIAAINRKDWQPLVYQRLCSDHFVGGQKLNVGFRTRATLNRLLEAGDVTPQQAERFHQAVLAFLTGAVEYAMAKLPLKESLLKHARFVDVQQRADCEVNDAAYFVDRFTKLLPYHEPQDQDQLTEEFQDYQLMEVPMSEHQTEFDVEAFWEGMSSLKNRTGLRWKTNHYYTLTLETPSIISFCDTFFFAK